MKIGIIGSGNVGGSLGVLWAKQGHDVVFGVRDPGGSKAQSLIEQAGDRAAAATLQETVQRSEVLVVALHWDVLPDILTSLDGWSGKTVVDATNRMYQPATGRSASEDLAAMIPGASVVKAFNSIGANNFADPSFNGERATMPYAGDDAEAKRIVRGLIEDLGFVPVDAGEHARAAALEALAVAWVKLAGSLGRSFALRIVRD